MQQTRQQHQDQLREDAIARQEAHKKLSPKEKLAKLDKKLGKGEGATRERRALEKQL